MKKPDDFDWGALGADWWRNAGEMTGADRKHVMFAAALHGGASMTKAARLAGYSDSGDATGGAMRNAGSRAAKTRAVKKLLALAEAEQSGLMPDRQFTPSERLRELNVMANQTREIKQKAYLFELISKEEDRQKTNLGGGYLFDTDGFGSWRIARAYIRAGDLGAAAYVLAWCAYGGSLASMPLLHDVVRNCRRAAPWLWERIVATTSADDRTRVDSLLADPWYQFDARKQLWGEIGVDIERPNDRYGETHRRGNGAQDAVEIFA